MNIRRMLDRIENEKAMGIIAIIHNDMSLVFVKKALLKDWELRVYTNIYDKNDDVTNRMVAFIDCTQEEIITQFGTHINVGCQVQIKYGHISFFTDIIEPEILEYDD